MEVLCLHILLMGLTSLSSKLCGYLKAFTDWAPLGEQALVSTLNLSMPRRSLDMAAYLL